MNNNKVINLFAHQKEMVKAADEHTLGVLVSPTGSGKTLTQAEIAAQEINKGGFRVILVKTPRILLSNQVAEEYNNYFFGNHNLEREIDYNSILVHSGKSPAEREDSEDDNSDMTDEEWADISNQLSNAYSHRGSIRELVEDAKANDIPFVIFTTYHSNIKAVESIGRYADRIKLDINDEGHYLVREDFAPILEFYTPARQYFFTATMRVTTSDEGKGMNNTDSFGEVIYKMPIKDAIAKNLILPVKPRVIKSHSVIDFDDEHKGIGEIVDQCFDDLLEKSDLDSPSLLVATNGGDQIDRFINSNAIETLLNKHNDLHILTVHSNKDLITYNDEAISRERFDELRKSVGDDDTQKMIMMHYDILSEGIDVAGLTGVVILRNMNEAKFLQTVGRCIRLYRKNPALKTHGLVYFPDLNDKDLRDNFFEMIKRSVEEGYVPSEFVSEVIAAGKDSEEDELTNFGADGGRSTRRNLDLYIAAGAELDKEIGEDIFNMNNQDTPQNMRTHLTRELILFVKKCVKFANDPEHVKAAFRSVCEATTVDTFVEAVRVFSEDPQVEVWRYADASFGVRTREEKHLAGQAKIKGDLFEMFCSAYFNVYGCTHNLFGTKVAPRDQEGWDFESTNENGSKCLIQAKYTYAGLYDGDLTTFWKQTAITEGVENKEGTLSSVLITSAHRHQLKRDEIKGTFKVIDRKHLKKRCDNPGFWRTFNTDYMQRIFKICWDE